MPRGAPQGGNTKGTFVKGHLCAYLTYIHTYIYIYIYIYIYTHIGTPQALVSSTVPSSALPPSRDFTASYIIL